MKTYIYWLLTLLILCGAATGALAEEPGTETPQPMLTWTDCQQPGYTNKNSDILRYCVWVETDRDTDLDGKADLVKVFVQVPRAAAEGEYKAGVLYDPTPYNAGIMKKYAQSAKQAYLQHEMDEADFDRECTKRTPGTEISTLEAAEKASQGDWQYWNETEEIRGYTQIAEYDYYLIRGYAVVECSGIGTYGSEGFPLTGTVYERDCHKNVIEWLTGDRIAFADEKGTVQVRADWSSGRVAMIGSSYGATLAYEVATTGVKGLETIISISGVANWYEYVNSQGVSLLKTKHYTDHLSAYIGGGIFTRGNMLQLNKYGSWLWQTAYRQYETNGDYAEAWDKITYAGKKGNNIQCTALIVAGTGDANCDTRQAEQLLNEFRKAKQKAMLILHRDGHVSMNGMLINGKPWEELASQWLAYYLRDEENGTDGLPEILAQSNTGEEWISYTKVKTKKAELKAKAEKEETVLTTEGYRDYLLRGLVKNSLMLDASNLEGFYSGLEEPYGQRYVLEAEPGTTLYGAAEVTAKIRLQNRKTDGQMVTAVLMDVSEDEFRAYKLYGAGNPTLKSVRAGYLEYGGNHKQMPQKTSGMEMVNRRVVAYGWLDLMNKTAKREAKTYVKQKNAPKGFTSYTFYMTPTIYTIEEGHHLELVLLTIDPAKIEPTIMRGEGKTVYDDRYSFTIDNRNVRVRYSFLKAAKREN